MTPLQLRDKYTEVTKETFPIEQFIAKGSVSDVKLSLGDRQKGKGMCPSRKAPAYKKGKSSLFQRFNTNIYLQG